MQPLRNVTDLVLERDGEVSQGLHRHVVKSVGPTKHDELNVGARQRLEHGRRIQVASARHHVAVNLTHDTLIDT